METERFTVTKGGKFKLKDYPSHLVKKLYKDEADYKKQLEKIVQEIDGLQQRMYAHDRYSVLMIFQAMDAAGKDGTIRAVMRGVCPHGVEVTAFKRPSEEELDHDYLWRSTKALPRRGTIGIFNRSYYEEVLICKVHPEIVSKYQRLPEEETVDMKQLWKDRYQAIRDLEEFLSNNGVLVLKFHLRVSEQEQAKRFLARLDMPEKNWKFCEEDVKERQHWADYMAAYERAIQETAAKHAPWFVVPADDKLNMRLIVASIIVEQMEKLKTSYPKVTKERIAELEKYRAALLSGASLADE